jgi:hypothetical protein
MKYYAQIIDTATGQPDPDGWFGHVAEDREQAAEQRAYEYASDGGLQGEPDALYVAVSESEAEEAPFKVYCVNIDYGPSMWAEEVTNDTQD